MQLQADKNVKLIEWCCQTNDCKHQIDGAIEIYALNN
jgi:hypothetical protein